MALSIFQLASNDQSVYYLGFIFGSVGDVLTPAGQTGSTVIGLIGTMLKALNLLALTVGVLIVVYITVVGVLATAHEGQFMGKDWSGLWVPIKMVLGIVALFPTGTGYSIIQIIIMWVVIQGVSAADTLWTTVLNYLQYMGSPYAAFTIPTTSMQQPMQDLFRGLVCQASALQSSNQKTVDGNNYYYYCNGVESKNPGWCSTSYNNLLSFNFGTTGTEYWMGPNGSCGKLVVSDLNDAGSCNCTAAPTGLSCLFCKAQRDVLQSIVTYMGGLAQSVATADSAYLAFYGSGNPPDPSTGQFISQFCSANGISPCCSTNTQVTQLPGAPASNCTTDNGRFYPSTGSDYVNASDNAVDMIYFPYVLKPLIQDGGVTKNMIDVAMKEYSQVMADTFTNYMLANPQSLTDWKSQAQANGWILAGSYYYQIAGMNHNNATAPVPVIKNQPGDVHAGCEVCAYRNNYSATAKLIGDIEDAATSTTPSNFQVATGSTQAGPITGALSSTANDLTKSFMNTVSNNGSQGIATDALVGVQSLGQQLMASADGLFLAFVVISLALLYSLGWAPFVLGTGLQTPGNAVSVGFLVLFGPIVGAFLLFLYAVGGLLGVYVPLIPYIIFTIGAMGWIIGVLEIMVAGPLIALGILSPGKGGHEILGRAEPALMGLFNLFLRPSLMIFGLVAAMFVCAVGVTIVNATFATVIAQITKTPPISMMIFFMAAYVGLVLSVLNKGFSLIHVVPDKVLTWIGGHHVPGGTGEATEAVGAAKEKVSGAAGAVAGAAAKPIGGGQLGGAAARKYQAQEDARAMKENQVGAQGTNDKPAGGDKGGGGGTTGEPTDRSG